MSEALKHIPVLTLAPLMFFVSIPIQFYQTNAGELMVPTGSVILYSVLAFTLALCILAAVGCLLRGKGLDAYCGLLFAMGVMLYLQSNFLFIRLNLLNGQRFDLSAYQVRIMINLILWGLAAVLCVVLTLKFPKIRKVYGYIAAALGAMQLLTVVLLLVMPGQSEKKPVEDFVVSTRGFNDVSEKENVIVLILDMFDDRYMTEILEKNPDITAELTGFEHYTNVTGKYSTTSYGVPYIVSQEPLLNQADSMEDILDDIYSHSQMLRAFAGQNYRIQVFTERDRLSSTTLDQFYNLSVADYVLSDPWRFAGLMMRVAAIRGLPDMAKEYVFVSTEEFNQVLSAGGETTLYDMGIGAYHSLIEEELTVVEEPILSFIHVNGAHYPYIINENLEVVENGSITYYEQALGTMRAVTGYLDKLKAAGVYDNATILITADHG